MAEPYVIPPEEVMSTSPTISPTQSTQPDVTWGSCPVGRAAHNHSSLGLSG